MSSTSAGGSPGTEPRVLLHRRRGNSDLPNHFTFLDPSSSPDPLDSFLSRHHAFSIRALLCIGFCPVPASTLRLLPSLRLVVATSAGLDHIDLAECRRRGIPVTGAGPVFAEDVADCAVALLLDVLRKISAGDRFVRGGFWSVDGAFPFPLSSKLGGKRVGIVGLGNVGSMVAKRLAAFGCKVAYTSRKEKLSAPYPYYSTVLELASNNDVLILCCSLTDETHHVINREVMTVLGKNRVIINVGRGSLVDEKELVEFLVRGDLGGAGLDVFEDEPNVPKELFDLDNVVLSPHTAVVTPESFKLLEDLITSNLKAFFSNKPLAAVVSSWMLWVLQLSRCEPRTMLKCKSRRHPCLVYS